MVLNTSLCSKNRRENLMLKLVNIVKDYPMKDQEPVHALKGLSVNFRRNEFVSILGPSGCGKTTLLNIIGGLDRYTSGDLIIEGKSTKDYKDGDWDTYRNHSIGFVFQTYNLIPHQSIIKNVELALTIGGVEKEERKQRAYKALEKVGLQGLERKKPNQLSGGQMQRVAIARALINEPEILLADEPTGALDSETSIQVMDLLKEVAKDCLVIMVTHNPDLANAYSSRIIRMKDGVLLEDSNPYEGEDTVTPTEEVIEVVEEPVIEEVIEEPEDNEPDLVVQGPIYIQHFNGGTLYHNYSPFKDTSGKKVVEVHEEPGVRIPVIKSVKEEPAPIEEVAPAGKKEKANKGNKKNSSMSFFTATGLSMSNLFSKLKRTILIAIAGSIGIIGVSSVLAVSFGVRGYIDNMQDDMLSQYPIEISETAVDYTSLLTGLSDWDKKEIVQFDLRSEVGVNSMINYLMDKYQDFTSVKTNDINKELISYINDAPKESVASLAYDYGLDVTNNIFTEWVRGAGSTEEEKNAVHNISLNGLTQMYISELKTVSGFSQYAQFVNLFTNFMNQLPGDADFLLPQYDLVGENSRFPANANELVVVVDDDQTMTDFLFAQMGFFSEEEFLNIAKQAIRVHEAREKYNQGDMSKEEFEAAKAEYASKYPYPQKYTIDDILGKKLTYYPQTSIWTYKEKTIQNVRSSVHMYNDITDPSKGTYDVKYNMSYNEGENILEGTFSSPEFYNGISFDLQLQRSEGSIIVVDKPYVGTWDLFKNQKFNFGGMDVVIDLYLIINEDGTTGISAKYASMMIPISDPTSTFTVKEEERNTYYYSADAQKSWTNGQEMKIVGILKKKSTTRFGSISRGIYYTSDFAKLMMDGAKDANIIKDPLHPGKGLKDYIGGDDENDGDPFAAYVEYKYTSFRKGEKEDEVQYNINGEANALNTSSGLSGLFSLTDSSAYDQDKTALRNLSGLATKMSLDETGVITTYSFEELPQSILIYPKNFNHKKAIVKHLDKWNDTDKDLTVTVDGESKTISGNDRDELTYVDTIEMIISVINTLITAITIALVVFTSLALVVSCFMIAVITYISTMERVKEIGVIRSLGGRKKDISRLFIAECLIIGLASGLIGIGVTYILELILNLSVAHLGVFGIADLPIYVALMMVGLSMLLNIISGLIPSMKASNQDPVIALRSE